MRFIGLLAVSLTACAPTASLSPGNPNQPQPPVLSYGFVAPAAGEDSHVRAIADPAAYRFDICVTRLTDDFARQLEHALQGGQPIDPDVLGDDFGVPFRVQLDGGRSLANNWVWVRAEDGQDYEIPEAQAGRADRIALQAISELGCVNDPDGGAKEWARRSLARLDSPRS